MQASPRHRSRWMLSLAAVAATAASLVALPGRAAVPATASLAAARADTAGFAGGCFWSMEHVFDHMPGVISATSGFSGGTARNPSYDQVSNGGTGHAETVQVVFDPTKTSYARLLDAYWHNIDPVSPNGQFCDHGTQYRTVIFAHGADQLRQAQASKTALERSGRFKSRINTQVVAAGPFYAAEEYHQHYTEKNPVHYALYRRACGRDQRLRELWGDSAGGQH